MILKSSKTGEKTTAASAFSLAAEGVNGLFDDLKENGPERKVRLHANYTDDDHFVIDTSEGSIQICAIVFEGELRLRVTHIPLIATAEYRHTDSGEVISQIASFAPMSVLGKNISTEVHKITETGETHIIARTI
ncbi:MAG: hypothetical protein HGA97_03115 [Chlorobiaceae bacterium]|nr:hypothetical protein [Chlorobiaceae bacterium]